MYRCVVAGVVLLPAIVGLPAQKSRPERNASVKLWLDTTAGNPCERSTPASGAWTVRNNEGRYVRVTVHRTMTEAGATKEDDVRDILGPGELRDLGCETSETGHQMLTLVKAVY